MLSSEALLLAADIGATKTSLALYTRDALGERGNQACREETMTNRNFSCFDDMLAVFLGPGGRIPPYACIAVAGPVLHGEAEMTNLRWRISEKALVRRHGFTGVWLINDLVAMATHVPSLTSESLLPLHTVRMQPPPGATLAIIAPGSGLGEAFLVSCEGEYRACPSEGGQASFAPRTAEQVDLLDFMAQKRAHVTVESVCSGLAVPELFAFMGARHTVPEWLDEETRLAEDATPAIMSAAQRAVEGKRVCGVAVHTINLLCDILADEAANLALKTMALGGVYLGGGLAPRLKTFLRPERFMDIFTRGHSSKLLERIPVFLILKRGTGLYGAGEYGLRQLARPTPAPQ